MWDYISSIFSPVNNKLWHFVKNPVSDNKITLNFTHDIYFQFNSVYTLLWIINSYRNSYFTVNENYPNL